MVGSLQTDDILQEIALIIFRSLRLLSDPGAFRPWVLRLASRYIFRHLKREARRRRIVEADPELISIAEASFISRDPIESDLLSAVEQLSPASRAVLLTALSAAPFA
jgi:DNA-directed RNA polymerase specialized sigma24 family protein